MGKWVDKECEEKGRLRKAHILAKSEETGIQ